MKVIGNCYGAISISHMGDWPCVPISEQADAHWISCNAYAKGTVNSLNNGWFVSFICCSWNINSRRMRTKFQHRKTGHMLKTWAYQLMTVSRLNSKGTPATTILICRGCGYDEIDFKDAVVPKLIGYHSKTIKVELWQIVEDPRLHSIVQNATINMVDVISCKCDEGLAEHIPMRQDETLIVTLNYTQQC